MNLKEVGKKLETFFEKILDHKITKIFAITGLIYWVFPYLGINIEKLGNPISIIIFSIAIVYGLPLLFEFLGNKIAETTNMLLKMKDILTDIKDIKKIKKDIEQIRNDIEEYKNSVYALRSNLDELKKEISGDGTRPILPTSIWRAFGSRSLFGEQRSIKEKIDEIEKRLDEIERKKMFDSGLVGSTY